MKNIVRFCLVASVSLSAFASAQAEEDEGLFLKPGSGAGKIAFINTQTRLSTTNLQAVINTLDPQKEYNIVCLEEKPGESATLKAKAGADLAIIVVDDKAAPTTLVAVDDGWAVVNVATLDRSLKTEHAKKKFFEGRCRRQLLRVFALAAGGASSMYNGNLCDPVKIEKLDLYKEMLPFDVIAKTEKYLTFIGVTKRVFVPYSEACQEGWAPAPTNEIQKAIWEEIHTPPKNPMTIEFDPKKGR